MAVSPPKRAAGPPRAPLPHLSDSSRSSGKLPVERRWAPGSWLS